MVPTANGSSRLGVGKEAGTENGLASVSRCISTKENGLSRALLLRRQHRLLSHSASLRRAFRQWVSIIRYAH